jgi:hypothetical protein
MFSERMTRIADAVVSGIIRVDAAIYVRSAV